MLFRIILISVLVAGAACATAPDPAPRAAEPALAPAGGAPARLLPIDRDARRWIDSILADLTLPEKVGQLMMPWMSGQYVPAGSAADSTLEDWVRERKVGGFVVSIGPPVGLAAKLNRLQRAADVPLLITTDMEHGPGQRLDGGLLLPWGTDLGGGTDAPPVMAIGAADDPRLAYELGRITAVEARAVGIHMNFAPVVDVNNNPANPIINTRSYGADPERVGRLAAAQIRGLQDHGMLATAKHFPGHGDTSDDSHLVPLILRIDAARADSVELPPFRAAIAEGVAGVMSAHIGFPALSGDPALPATLSPRMLDSLLVREMGFEGLVITDALNMGAIVQAYGVGDAAVRALEAGADILLMPPDLGAAVDAVLEAVRKGRITEERVDRSVRKLLEAKARVGLHRARVVDLEAVADRVGVPAHDSLATVIAERGVTLVRDREGVLPLRPLRDRRVLSVVYTDDVDPFAGRDFQARLGARLPSMRRVLLGPGEPAARLDSLAAWADSADVVLFTASVRVRSSKGSVAVEPDVAERVRAIAERRPTVVVSLGNPYILQQMPTVGTYLLGWGKDAASQRAAADALLGDIPVTGRLPIDIPPLHALGSGLHRPVPSWSAERRPARDEPRLALLDSVDAVIARAIADGVTPGAALAVGGPGGLDRLRGYGATDWAPGSAAVTDSTVYDLASLTKVVGTTTAVMLMVDDGRIRLDAPLSEYLARWPRGGWRDSVTIRRLLAHEAGLPPFVRFWHPDSGSLRGPDAVVRAIAALEPAYTPGERYVYSDLGFILLGAAVEAVAGRPLPELLENRVWQPLGMDDTGYNPAPDLMADVRAEGGLGADRARARRRGGLDLRRIAPTERDTVFRRRHVHGVVHDENAYAMGGVAGHAGLFSSARDLARFARMLLNGGTLGGSRVLRPATIAAFIAPGSAEAPGSRRVLGWDTPPGSGDMAARLSARAFGHTGFTGTSLWLDPESDLFVVLLTNRVNPTRDNPRIGRLRRDVHELLARAAATGGGS